MISILEKSKLCGHLCPKGKLKYQNNKGGVNEEFQPILAKGKVSWGVEVTVTDGREGGACNVLSGLIDLSCWAPQWSSKASGSETWLQIGSKAHRIYSLLCPPHLAPSFLHMHTHIHAEAPEVKHLLPNLKKENKITVSYSKENKPLLWGEYRSVIQLPHSEAFFFALGPLSMVPASKHPNQACQWIKSAIYIKHTVIHFSYYILKHK